MKITDVLGVGKILPIDKLVDTVFKAMGKISKPYFDRRDIDTKTYEITKLAGARAEEMKIISNAIRENLQEPRTIEYKEEKLTILSERATPEEAKQNISIEPPLSERTRERLDFQEAKRQINIESVTGFAAEELRNEQPVTDEPLDEDWTTRFFRIAGDISNEEMQALWGKILAGEIKQPKTYSLRTLELIRNLTKEEAGVFIKVANLSINYGNDYFIYKGNSHELSEKFNVSFNDIALLTEVDLILPGDFVNFTLYQLSEDGLTTFVSGNIVIFVNKKANSPKMTIPIFSFTKSGRELLKLVSPEPPFNYLTAFAKSLKQESVEVKYGHIVKKEAGSISYEEPLLDFPTT